MNGFFTNNFVDFPGGRLDDTEYTLPLKEGLQRELSEELGYNIQYTIKDLAFVSKRDYIHFGQHHIVVLFYEVEFHGGDFTLTDEHEKLEWLTPKELLARKARFQSGTEYDELKAYLKKVTCYRHCLYLFILTFLLTKKYSVQYLVALNPYRSFQLQVH